MTRPLNSVRSRCDSCGYACGLKPGRSCPECGGNLEADSDAFRRPSRKSRTSRWVLIAVVALVIGIMWIWPLTTALF